MKRERRVAENHTCEFRRLTATTAMPLCMDRAGADTCSDNRVSSIAAMPVTWFSGYWDQERTECCDQQKSGH